MNLSTSETVLALDRFQHTEQRRLCQIDPDHGALTAHSSGAHLVCGWRRCEYVEPVSTDLVAEAIRLR